VFEYREHDESPWLSVEGANHEHVYAVLYLTSTHRFESHCGIHNSFDHMMSTPGAVCGGFLVLGKECTACSDLT